MIGGFVYGFFGGVILAYAYTKYTLWLSKKFDRGDQ